MALDIPRGSASHKAKEALDRLMNDFSQDEETQDSYAGKHIKLPKKIVLHTHMIYIIFVIILGYRYLGHGEKVAWTIPILFKGLRIQIAFQKFGLTFRAIDKGASKPAVIREMAIILNKAGRLSDQIIQPVIKDQIEKGNITLVNHHYSLHWRYQYLREQANKVFTLISPFPRDRQVDSVENILGNIPKQFELQREGVTYGLAMLDSWFSYLEHIMVLMLPFFNYNPSEDNLTKFIRRPWGKKYQRIFCPERNSDMMGLLEELKNIKERFRNTFAHGAFEKGESSLSVHLAGLGAIPATLSRFHESVHYSIQPLDSAEFKDVCAIIDRFEDRIHQSPYDGPLAIIEAGLDIYFHKDGCNDYQKAIESKKSLVEFVEYESWQQTNAMNMDW